MRLHHPMATATLSTAPLVLSMIALFLASTVCAELNPGTGFLSTRNNGHAHHHHNAPLLVLNETELSMHHSPTPESYYTIDWEGAGGGARHPSLIVMHAIFMCLAFFIALPLGIALRSVKHAGRSFAIISFYVLSALGCVATALYRKLTPNMYAGAVHARHGYFLLLLALSLSTIDILSFFYRLFWFLRSDEIFTFKSFWTLVVLGKDIQGYRRTFGAEYVGLVAHDAQEEFDETKVHPSVNETYHLPLRGHDSRTADWAINVQQHQSPHRIMRHHRHQSGASERTLYADSSPARSLDDIQAIKFTSGNPLACRLRELGYVIVERLLVVGGFAQLLMGIVTYTGGCREYYANGCLAHLIKGGIFWLYGLFTFARFLGSFSEAGWGWNRTRRKDSFSFEFVECFVIFAYGASNMWMERFGANAGDPFTTRQIQHISIAVMFCFAGLIGMGIESIRIRRWLSSGIFVPPDIRRMEPDLTVEPPSYLSSFNPFPAMVIGVTGAAMASHEQPYVFQVQIHQLWGNLLVAFSVLRCLTYFFLWLSPPRSIFPSRPPTEALASFFLACGGLVFMFSTEEVTIAAMRRGRDDVMMFLNVAVAITCFAFCWTLFIVSFKGWLKSRYKYPALNNHTP